MSPTILENLPAEILLQICECLDRDHLASVVAFSCANKYCYFSVAALLFRTIKFDVSTRLNLHRDVQECCNMLKRTGSFRHVRRLVLNSPYRRSHDSWSSPDNKLEPSYQWHRPAISVKERGYGVDTFDWDDGINDANAGWAPFEFVYETNDDWRRLTDMIKQLPSLVDLIFACDFQFPPCLLQELQHRGQCRLHIKRFRLLSLNAPVMDAHEFMLATSPLLHSIGVGYHEGGPPLRLRLAPHSQHLQPIYQREAAVHQVAGLAPNLKEVHMFQRNRSRSQYNAQDTGQPWRRFMLDNKKCSLSRGALRCLQLPGYEGINILRDLIAKNDFSLLRTLQFNSGIDDITYDFLTTNCSFPSLDNLFLNLITLSGYRVVPSEDYFHAAGRFLQSLPPLCTLILGINVPQIIFDSALDHHGSRLRKLHLLPQSGTDCISMGDIARIKERCPLLEDLGLAIHRSRGDSTEIATYKAIGSIPRVRHVSIILNATNFAEQTETPNSTTSVFDDPWRAYNSRAPRAFNSRQISQIRYALINNAIDKTLSQQIFAAISLGKPAGSLSLERLTVLPHDGDVFPHQGHGPPGIVHVMWVLRQSWEIQLNPRDDAREELLARQLYQLEDIDRCELHPLLEPIFRELWTSKNREGNSDWYNDWHSWPLSTLETHRVSGTTN